MSTSVKYLCLLSILLCLALGAVVFWTGQHVHQLNTDIHIKNQQLLKEHERIRVLRAEWSLLNSPKRLDDLMERKKEQENPQQSQSGQFTDPQLKGTRINTPAAQQHNEGNE